MDLLIEGFCLHLLRQSGSAEPRLALNASSFISLPLSPEC